MTYLCLRTLCLVMCNTVHCLRHLLLLHRYRYKLNYNLWSILKRNFLERHDWISISFVRCSRKEKEYVDLVDE